MSDDVLTVKDLHTYFYTNVGVVKAVNGVSFSLKQGRILGIVGESGSGKTVTAYSIMRLVPFPGRVVEGEVHLDGMDIYDLDQEELRQIRGRDISMIFQDPLGGLNPIVSVRTQVAELLTAHLPMSQREANRAAIDILAGVGLADPEMLADRYPFQLSGGMAQRVMIGIAMALRPKVLIADEPTSALDVTIQAQILSQIRGFTQEHNTAVILITHDMGVIAQMADEVAVMYAGSIVEYGSVADVFRYPSHPYTWALMQALPRVDDLRRELRVIPGAPPDLIDLPDECPFIPR
ncbi:MAG: Methionine transporter ATP-binding protein, partial [Dehalococcoidia bacterium]|nr:Methionine transporter ATP-binding protein [Dehalococcoidia bacterium]